MFLIDMHRADVSHQEHRRPPCANLLDVWRAHVGPTEVTTVSRVLKIGPPLKMNERP